MRVKFFSLFKLNLKKSAVEYQLEGQETIWDLIQRLDKDFDGYFSEKLIEDGELKRGSIIMVNGQNILHLDKLQTRITDSDEVVMFPPSAGG